MARQRPVYVEPGARIDLGSLAVLAEQFDEISAEADYRAVASEFVRWLQRESASAREGFLHPGTRNARAGTSPGTQAWNDKRAEERQERVG